jgi:glycosyltransferase involved in cell wall biosynthesis/GT2 family glycosyltransferase
MGGVGTYSVILPPLLAADGHDVTILTKEWEGAPLEAVEGGCRVLRLAWDHPWRGGKADEDNELFANEMRSLRSFTGIFAREVARRIWSLHAERPFDVVISQDVEAPTWLAQDRRMILGDNLDLPFVVFVHSPVFPIQVHNEDSCYNHSDYHRHLYERQSMSLADGLIVASRSMAAELARDIGPDPTRVRTIPLPCGDIPAAADFDARLGSRPSDKELRLVFSGRLELRKGVDTLFDAVVPLMREDPRITLHMLGRDTRHPTLPGMVGERLLARLPDDLKGRIVLRGWMPREELWAEYAGATLGVVPSPWEPFSFACQEMMACGTPVVASATGGMADMIRSGWNGLLCEPGDVASLRNAIRNSLGDARQRRNHAANAARSIREFCDNRTILARTLEFLRSTVVRNKREVAKARRIPPPGNLPFGDLPAWSGSHAQPSRPAQQIGRVGVVVPCYNLGEYLGECLDSLARQTFAGDLRTYVVDDGSTAPATKAALEAAKSRKGVQVLHIDNRGLPGARNAGAAEALRQGCNAIVFLDCDDWVADDYIAKAAAVLDRHPECGAVTAWTHSVGMMNTYWCPPHTQFPFSLVQCTSTPAALVRREAFEAVGGMGEDMRYAYEDWDFWVALAGAGYVMLAIPEPLLFYRIREGSMSRLYNPRTREHGRRRMAQHHEELFRRYAREVVLLQDDLLHEARRRYDEDVEPLRRQCEGLVVDVAWNQKEWQHYKRLYEESKAKLEELSR